MIQDAKVKNKRIRQGSETGEKTFHDKQHKMTSSVLEKFALLLGGASGSEAFLRRVLRSKYAAEFLHLQAIPSLKLRRGER